MHYKVLYDIIKKEQIQKILELFETHAHIRETRMGMDKLKSPWIYDEIRELEPVIGQYVDTSVNIGDNVYKHSFPYYPHVDIDERYPCVNVLIPLYVSDNMKQDFVIFDQYVKEPIPKTWIGNQKFTGTFEKNTIGEFIHNDTNVEGSTNNKIDEEFYKQYLEHEYRDRDLFYGCSGTAVDYAPGNMILWDSKHIHCTGKMNAKFKIGLSLRFRGIFNS